MSVNIDYIGTYRDIFGCTYLVISVGASVVVPECR